MNSNPDSIEILAGRYSVQRQLGKAAGRRTLLAYDLERQAQVVIKLLLFGNDFTWDELKLFEREAEILQTLSHPSIPQYLDHFEIDLSIGKGFALVQTYIDARSLAEHFQARQSFSEAEIQQLATAILEILIDLHGQQPPVIHRDIKPSNILLASRSDNSIGQVYLVDFGSVQTLAAREGSTITVVGTYGYMPPEQFGGRSVSASDLYSLGATLIYLITGRHPADLPQQNLRIQFESVVRSSPSLTRWLKQMTEPSLDRRFASAEAALNALNQPERSITPVQFQPQGSKILLNRSTNMLTIILPPTGLSERIASVTLSAISLMTCAIVLVAILGMGLLTSTGIILNLVYFLLLTMFGSVTFAAIAALLLQTQLQIDSQSVFCVYQILGLRYRRYLGSSQAISKLVYSPRSQNDDRPSGIAIWIGTQCFEFGSALTESELEWLVQELSDWLGLSIEQK